MRKAALGFRSKTGRAIAVVLAAGPSFVWRGEVKLLDESYPAALGPYHTVMEMPWSDAQIAVQPLITSIQGATDRMLASLLDDMRARDFDIRAIGVVGSQPRDLAKIGNHHIRAHAAEGGLFREVIVNAARKQRLRVSAHSEDELAPDVAKWRSTLAKLGKEAGPPWRKDERLAATAAWLGGLDR